MTVISALVSKNGIAVASDSLLTVVDSKGSNQYLEWKQSKIISVPKLKACISYWGFAGTLKNMPQKREDVPEWQWQTYNWLKKETSNSKFKNLEDFSKDIRDKLESQLRKIKFKKNTDKGIGLHIAGIETVNGFSIPELFLVCNFTDPSYTRVADLVCSRNTFHSIKNVPSAPEHNRQEFRFAVREFLKEGHIITYNNGDPMFFNMVSSSISNGFKIALDRKVIKRIISVQDTVPMVRRPIEIISEIQKDFYKHDKRVVGGRVHDIAIDNRGIIYSTSGDK